MKKIGTQDLLITFLVLQTFLLITLILNVSNTYLELSFLALFFFFSGYNLLSIIYSDQSYVSLLKKPILILMLSFLITISISLILKYLIWGLQLTSLTLFLAIISSILALIALIMRARCSRGEDPDSSNRININKKIAVIIPLVIIFSIFSTQLYAMNQTEKFTDFYILGPNATASNYPTNLTVGQQGKVLVGVVNHEGRDIDYQVVVKYDNTTLETYNVTLANNQKWEQNVTFRSAFAGNNRNLKFILYKNSDIDPYKTLDLFIRVINPVNTTQQQI